VFTIILPVFFLQRFLQLVTVYNSPSSESSVTTEVTLCLCLLFDEREKTGFKKSAIFFYLYSTVLADSLFLLQLCGILQFDCASELEFTVVYLQILVWIYVNAIHSHVFILDLPANIDFWNLYNSILAGESVCL
jgi:hypothetical protein